MQFFLYYFTARYFNNVYSFELFKKTFQTFIINTTTTAGIQTIHDDRRANSRKKKVSYESESDLTTSIELDEDQYTSRVVVLLSW